MPTYKLTEGSIQHGFANSRNKVQIFGGGFANGKTTALVIKALRVARDYPGANMLLARETYPKLNDTLRKVFLKWCPEDWVKRFPTQEDNTCYFKNGTVINFRYVAQRGKSNADGSTTSNLLSATYDFIGVDQVEDPGITYKDFLDLLGRLRGDTPYRPPDGEEDDTMPPSGPRWIVLTLNPANTWAYKELIQPYIIWRDRGVKTDKLIVDPSTGEPLIDLFEGSTYTNEKNLPLDYLRGLESTYRGQQRDRYLMGKYAAFEGLVYGNFDRVRNALTREQALNHLARCKERHVAMKVFEAYDFGISSPTCYLFAFVDDYGRVVIIDGFYKPDSHYTEHPRLIREVRSRYMGFLEPNKPIIADPSIFRRTAVADTKNTGDTVRRLLEDLDSGLRFTPGMNDMVQGIAKVSAYINGLPDIPHIITGECSVENPGPLLYVVDDLEWWLNEVDTYYWKRNPQGIQLDEPIGGTDHAMDATKYMLSKMPEPSKIVIPSKLMPPAWMFWHETEGAMQR
jgi:hypothetical protein